MFKYAIHTLTQSDDSGELEMYGGQSTAGPMMNPFHFEVCDTLLNIAPIKSCTVGQPGFQSEEVQT